MYTNWNPKPWQVVVFCICLGIIVNYSCNSQQVENNNISARPDCLIGEYYSELTNECKQIECTETFCPNGTECRIWSSAVLKRLPILGTEYYSTLFYERVCVIPGTQNCTLGNNCPDGFWCMRSRARLGCIKE